MHDDGHDATTAAAATSARVLAIVYCGNRFVEVTDASVTLHDLCVAFDIADVTSVYVRERDGGRVVATLPFEALPLQPPRDDDVDDVDDDGYEDNDDTTATRQRPHRQSRVIVYDVVTRNSSDAPATAAAAAAETATAAGDDSHGNDHHAAASMAGTHAALATALQSLVELGAVDLLTSELPQRLAQLRAYAPDNAPGLLRRRVYAPTVYSPYRTHRDPLCAPDGHNHHHDHHHHNNDDNGDCFCATLPYRSAIELYEADMTYILQGDGHDGATVAATLGVRPFAAHDLVDDAMAATMA